MVEKREGMGEWGVGGGWGGEGGRLGEGGGAKRGRAGMKSTVLSGCNKLQIMGLG